jgi:hypothetical protein
VSDKTRQEGRVQQLGGTLLQFGLCPEPWGEPWAGQRKLIHWNSWMGYSAGNLRFKRGIRYEARRQESVLTRLIRGDPCRRPEFSACRDNLPGEPHPGQPFQGLCGPGRKLCPVPYDLQNFGIDQAGHKIPLARTPRGYVDNDPHDFGSMLRFVEHNFGTPEGALNFGDARATNNLTSFFKFANPPRVFQHISALKGADYFVNDKSPCSLWIVTEKHRCPAKFSGERIGFMES